MAQYFDPQGRAIALGKELGAGGEGAVFEIAGDPKRVAKIYHQPATPEKAVKLRAMAALATQRLTATASWPLSVLQNSQRNSVAGIIVPRISGHAEIHNLYSPAHRKVDYPDKDWSFLLHVAMNTCAAFDAIHEHGHVIGDVNQGNLLVSPRGTVFLIDCDSFQVSSSGSTYSCDVGVPQYTPPELQGRSFRGLARSANHDRFGLALVIFHLLFMGRHPFAGRYSGTGDMPIEQAIAEYRYAFGANAAAASMARPPHTLPLERVAPTLAPLFERAFGRGSERADARPSADAWHAALLTVSKQLIVCGADRGHRHVSALGECPWCRLMLDGAPNFFLSVTFRGTTTDVLDVTPQLATLVQTLRAAPRPQPRPFPGPPAQLSIVPTPPPPELHDSRVMTMMLGGVALLSLFGMLGIFVVPESGLVSVPMFAVFTVWWAVMFFLTGTRKEVHHRSQVLRGRRGQLKQLQNAWQGAISHADNQYKRTQKELRGIYEEILKLKGRHDGDLRKLGRDVFQRQLNAFLQSKFISDARIDGIGPGRTATLESYGIETAADVDYNRVLAVPGMGPAVTNNIVAWRTSLERQFTVDKKQGVPPAERQALLLKYAQVRQQFELKLRGGPETLSELNRRLQVSLDQLEPQIAAAYTGVAQAYADVEAMRRQARSRAGS